MLQALISNMPQLGFRPATAAVCSCAGLTQSQFLVQDPSLAVSLGNAVQPEMLYW